MEFWYYVSVVSSDSAADQFQHQTMPTFSNRNFSSWNSHAHSPSQSFFKWHLSLSTSVSNHWICRISSWKMPEVLQIRIEDFFHAIASQAVQVQSSHQAGKDSEVSYQIFNAKNDAHLERWKSIEITESHDLNPSFSTLWMKRRRPTLFLLSMAYSDEKRSLSAMSNAASQFHQITTMEKWYLAKSNQMKIQSIVLWSQNSWQTNILCFCQFLRTAKHSWNLKTPQLFWFDKMVRHIVRGSNIWELK